MLESIGALKAVKYTISHLFYNYAIRDTSVHESMVIEWRNPEALTIYIHNMHDQALTIIVKGNVEATALNSVQMADAFNVPAGEATSITLTPETTGYLPFILITAQASTAPTSGTVNAVAVQVNKEEA